MDRIEFYPDDWDERVNFEAIMWKRSGRSKAIPGLITFTPVTGNKFGQNAAEVEKNNTKMFAPLNVWALLEKEKVRSIKF